MKEVVFLNFTLKYPTELYYDTEMPTMAEICAWQEQLAKGRFIKWGLSYHADKSSFIASYTDKGGNPKEPDPVVTAFGGSMLSAYQKLYVVVEIFGLCEYGEPFARERCENAEFALSEELAKLLRKKP